MANDDKPKLPKRLYYRLSEAAEYLTKNGMECSEADLLHFGAIAQLFFVTMMKRDWVIKVHFGYEREVDEFINHDDLGECTYVSTYTKCFTIGSPDVAEIERAGEVVISGLYIFEFYSFTFESLNSGTPFLRKNTLKDYCEVLINIRSTRLQNKKTELNASEIYVSGFSVVSINDSNDNMLIRLNNNDLWLLKSELDRLLHGGQLTAEQQEQLSNEPKKNAAHPRTLNNQQKAINALIKELTERHAVPESNIANIIINNSDLLGESVPQSSVYEILKKAKRQ